ncbi:AI-2E family transporter [Parapedobacter pyrenivorans]|uniref:AI-2E family transporter n=1 Tax=Parapedobacter pyrenivorans TaxID=1305674 RepID=A0A917I0R2_9SPHI|nr:AI-2E family transporter [Parapedobacter pyrenivorans]GGH02256.1 AI-2E family transporter [Parapedobacter pyrenivorans]
MTQQASSRRAAYVITTATFSVAGLYFAAPFLIPIVLAALLAMLLTGTSNRLERGGMSRGLASFILVLALVCGLALLFIVLSWQVNRLADDFGEMKEKFIDHVSAIREWVSDTLGIGIDEQEKMLNEQKNSATGQADDLLFNFINTLATVAVNTVLVVVYTFLLLLYRSHLKKVALRIVPDEKKQNTDRIIHKSVAVSGNYLTGLFSMIAVLWVMYSIGFGIVGLEGAILFAILCGILEIVPFFGNFVGNLIAIFAVLAQGGDGRMVLGIVAVYLLVQFLQTYVLEPLVVGQQVNINPLFTIMGLVAGELLWGIAGMALAIPVIGIIKIICDNVPELHAYGVLIGPERAKKNRTSFFHIVKRKFRQK